MQLAQDLQERKLINQKKKNTKQYGQQLDKPDLEKKESLKMNGCENQDSFKKTYINFIKR